MARSDYERGLALGRSEKELREAGIHSDLRWDLADESKRLSREAFAEFKRGLSDGLRDVAR